MDWSPELQLIWCIGLGALVLAASWRIASRLGAQSLPQVLLDTLLINYLLEYVIVCGLGLVGLLTPAAITVAAFLALAIAWISTARSNRVAFSPRTGEFRATLAILLFGAGYLLSYAFYHASASVLETDALAYHLPTAIGWLQTHRLTLFPAWYWNPANTFSPLAAEAFMAFLIAPFRSDMLVRFVQIPALLMIALAMYRLGRHLRARPILAACVAVATMLSRTIFAQGTLVKDDLFVAAFFVTAVVGLAEAGDHCSQVKHDCLIPWRIGIAIGLLIATKYPALLTLPLLLLAIPWSQVRQWGWRQTRGIGIVLAGVSVLAGPWFLRNCLYYGNPLFPMIIRLGGWQMFAGMFNVSRDASTRTAFAIWSMVTTQGRIIWPIQARGEPP
jgi:hypothetical protein